MKLLLVIGQERDADALIKALNKQGFQTTRIDTSGGFLKERNATVLIGLQDFEVEDALILVRTTCQVRTREVVDWLSPATGASQLLLPNVKERMEGGATVFVLNAERHERL